MTPSVRACRFARSGPALLVLPALLSWVVPVDGQGQPFEASAGALATDAEREHFLASARIIRTRPARSGVTGTLRATLSDGTVTHDASIQTVDEYAPVMRGRGRRGTEFNFKDSWRLNVAAYRIDRLLELGMIPTTVERRHLSRSGSFTWWVDDVLMDETERFRGHHRAPSEERWSQQLGIARMFDQLIANVDRNLGNLLIDTRWNLWMIDHSRAFRLNKELRAPGNLSKVERGVLDRLRRLDRPTLQRAAGDYIFDDEIDALLARRDRIVDYFDRAGPTALFDRERRCC